MIWEFSQINLQITKEINIIDIIKDYIFLNKKGKNFIGICPFHEDKNPSMIVSTSKQIFKCFSCGIGGTGLKFVVLIENISFKKAYKKLIEKFGLKNNEKILISTELTKDQELKLIILKEMHNFYRIKLFNPPKELKLFLNKRKINEYIIEKYELGWAPKNGKKLIEFLNKKKYSEEELLKTNFFNIFDNNLSDYFYDRLLFPLKNEDDKLIGFSGRIINSKNEKSKFLISRDSDIFNKTKILFNFSNIQKRFKNIKRIYLTEGFMDAIRLTELNYPSVAVLGTYLTSNQTSLIKESYKEVVIVPDGDKPGIESTKKNSLILSSFKIKTLIFDHQLNMDPDELLIKFPKLISEKEKWIVNPIKFIINQYINNTKIKNWKNNFIKEIIPFLKLESEINRDIWLKKIEKKLNISYNNLKKDLENIKIKISDEKNELKEKNNKILTNETALLFFIIIYPKFFLKINKNKIESSLKISLNKKIFKLISSLYKNNYLLTKKELFKKIENNILKNEIKFIINNPIFENIKSLNDEKINKEINNLIKILKIKKT